MTNERFQLFVIGIGVCGFGLTLAVDGLLELWERRFIQRTGVQATAEPHYALALDRARTAATQTFSGERDHWLQITEANGAMRGQSFSIEDSFWLKKLEHPANGMEVDVWYLPTDPERAFVVGTQPLSIRLAPTGCGLAIVGMIFIVFSFRGNKSPPSASHPA